MRLSGDPFDGGDGPRVRTAIRVESPAESLPMAVQGEKEFFASEGSVVK